MIHLNTSCQRLRQLLPICWSRQTPGFLAISQKSGFDEHCGIVKIPNHKKVCRLRPTHFGMDRLNYRIAKTLSQTFFGSIQRFLGTSKFHKHHFRGALLRAPINFYSLCGWIRGKIAMEAHEDGIGDGLREGYSIGKGQVGVFIPGEQSLETEFLQFLSKSNT